jgi:hypothetical protein
MFVDCRLQTVGFEKQRQCISNIFPYNHNDKAIARLPPDG